MEKSKKAGNEKEETEGRWREQTDERITLNLGKTEGKRAEEAVTGRALTSRIWPGDRVHTWASSSGRWASRRQPARTACSNTPPCTAASLAARNRLAEDLVLF